MVEIFTEEQKKLADFILEKNQLMPLSELYSSQVQNLAIEWSYYSGKIEGNTYTFVETEMLLQDNIVATKDYKEAKMLKNLYNTFISECEYIKGNKQEELINKGLLYRLHSQLTDDLIYSKNRGVIRTLPVQIRGTHYRPPANSFEIEKKLTEIMETQKILEQPIEKAIYLHCNIARLQPFIDGNKRTSRMLEGIVLMNADIVPIFSIDSADIKMYKDALIYFYETGDYSQYIDYFFNQKIKYLQCFAHQDLMEEFENRKGLKL